jgi:hypothetical protein
VTDDSEDDQLQAAIKASLAETACAVIDDSDSSCLDDDLETFSGSDDDCSRDSASTQGSKAIKTKSQVHSPPKSLPSSQEPEAQNDQDVKPQEKETNGVSSIKDKWKEFLGSDEGKIRFLLIIKLFLPFLSLFFQILHVNLCSGFQTASDHRYLSQNPHCSE